MVEVVRPKAHLLTTHKTAHEMWDDSLYRSSGKQFPAQRVQFQEIPTRNLELATADTDTIDPNIPILQGGSFSLLIVFCLPVAGAFFSPSRKVGAKSLSNAQDR